MSNRTHGTPPPFPSDPFGRLGNSPKALPTGVFTNRVRALKDSGCLTPAVTRVRPREDDTGKAALGSGTGADAGDAEIGAAEIGEPTLGLGDSRCWCSPGCRWKDLWFLLSSDLGGKSVSLPIMGPWLIPLLTL